MSNNTVMIRGSLDPEATKDTQSQNVINHVASVDKAMDLPRSSNVSHIGNSSETNDNSNNPWSDPQQWETVVTALEKSIHPEQKIKILQKLVKIVERLSSSNDLLHRRLYTTNSVVQRTILAFDGGLEFLYNLGFEPDTSTEEPHVLICHNVNQAVNTACITCVKRRIDMLMMENFSDIEDYSNPWSDPQKWGNVISTMETTMHPQQKVQILKKLRNLAKKPLGNKQFRYRQVFSNNPKVQAIVLQFDGGLEFLYNLGFEPDPQSPDKLLCHTMNKAVNQACMTYLVS